MAERVGRAAFLRQQRSHHAPPRQPPRLCRASPCRRWSRVGERGRADPARTWPRRWPPPIPGARLRRFAGAGHLPPMETPEAVNAALLRAWLVA